MYQHQLKCFRLCSFYVSLSFPCPWLANWHWSSVAKFPRGRKVFFCPRPWFSCSLRSFMVSHCYNASYNLRYPWEVSRNSADGLLPSPLMKTLGVGICAKSVKSIWSAELTFNVNKTVQSEAFDNLKSPQNKALSPSKTICWINFLQCSPPVGRSLALRDRLLREFNVFFSGGTSRLSAAWFVMNRSCFEKLAMDSISYIRCCQTGAEPQS